MAKGKQAATLFEVINSRRSLKSPIETPSRPGFWSFLRRPRVNAPPEAAPTAEPAVPADAGAPAGAVALPVASTAAALPPRHQGITASIDPEHQQIHVKVSYRTAIICGFAAVVVITCAFVAGKKLAGGPQTASGRNIEDVRHEPANPKVLEPAGHGGTAETTGGDRGAGHTAGGGTPPAWNDPHPPGTLVVRDSNRIIGRTYIIAQSYQDEKLAREASDFLTAGGVPCTVEKDLAGWATAPGWYSVVGIDAFERQSDTAYQDEMKKIKQLSEKFAPRGGWKAFDARPYTWKAKRGN